MDNVIDCCFINFYTTKKNIVLFYLFIAHCVKKRLRFTSFPCVGNRRQTFIHKYDHGVGCCGGVGGGVCVSDTPPSPVKLS